MTSKSFRADAAALKITPSMEKSVAKAFEEFAPKNEPRQYSGVLVRRVDPHACRHSWRQANSLSKEHSDYLQAVTEEKPEPGAVKWCANCGSVSYWEDGELWLFDATTRFFGRPPKRKHREHRERR